MNGEAVQPWLGRHWTETVTSVGTDQVRRMLSDATSAGVSAFGRVTQRFPSGLELPIEYTAVRLGKHGNLLAVGKSVQAVEQLQSRLVAAQRARERDYWKLRDVETRYRMLFDASTDAVVLLAMDTLHVLDANPAALRAFGFTRDHEFLADFSPTDQDALRGLLQRARDQGRVPGILVHLGSAAEIWSARASLLPTEQGSVFLLQLNPMGTHTEPPATPDAAAEAFFDAIPDGVVALDEAGVIRRANPAFAEFVQHTSKTSLAGQSLGIYLAQPGADLAVLLGYFKRHRTVRQFTTILTGALGTEVEVEIAGAATRDASGRGYGLVIRDIGRRLADTPPARAPAESADLSDRVGTAPLATLVLEATEQIERQCIQAAIKRTSGNISAAAGVLGLSRQSLHAKLNRYGIARADA